MTNPIEDYIHENPTGLCEGCHEEFALEDLHQCQRTGEDPFCLPCVEKHEAGDDDSCPTKLSP